MRLLYDLFLQANSKDMESFPWYDTLMFYGFRNEDDYDREDDDIKLIPRIIEKIVLPKLSGMSIVIFLKVVKGWVDFPPCLSFLQFC